MRVVVAMSGGVDSSVVAGLLHEAGHDVIGVTLQLYDHGVATGRRGACCAGQDIHDARQVADHLGIPHYVIDAEARFREAVIRDFADSYAAGETPVPCVRCNQSVKFTDLYALARDLGAERLATGHYVRRVDRPDGPWLLRAADPARDQSWFLFATTREQLAFALFPLGTVPAKAAVRGEATRLGLPVAAKPDSQDICFVPSGNYADVVGRMRPESLRPGEIVAEDGRVIGRHEGLARYTVGQAKRLGPAAQTRSGDRRVVVGLDPARNQVLAGPATGGSTGVTLRDVNWLADRPSAPGPCRVKLRARAALQDATVGATPGNGAQVTLAIPTLAAPGQACVFYDGQRILGGGFICPPPPAGSAVDGRLAGALSPAPSGEMAA
ncbi:MAG: tRNA 2-thiouridine(34) synthase MnmA [Acetobacteraceae bacterium]|nr:tRNA 2-thiouridine(34) synthase MnmA [Acetobacteraceae bacterium]